MDISIDIHIHGNPGNHISEKAEAPNFVCR